jgi:pimeloyl-ACP methyl ester carboxylesterase
MPTELIGDLRMHYVEAGPRRGAPVMLVHGLGGSSAVWSETLGALAAAGYRAVAVDCRGHGESGKPARPTSIGQMAEDVAGLHSFLALEAAHWVGSSMGGAISMAAALAHPEQVRSLSLVDTWARTDPEFAALLDQRLAALDGPEPALETYARLAFLQAHSERFRRAHPEAFEVYRARVAQADRPALRAAIGALRAHDLDARLGQIRVPTTVMVGEADTLTPPRHAEHIASRIPFAKLVRFPEVGHLAMVEAHADFWSALETHLSGAS